MSKSNVSKVAEDSQNEVSNSNDIPKLNFGIIVARFDESVQSFTVSINNNIILLNHLIGLILAYKGSIESFGVSYNPAVGVQCQELVLMYKVQYNPDFVKEYEKLSKSLNINNAN